MPRRYHITLGAGTTAGGLVTTASSMCSILGVPMALEGDKVSCPACQSEGSIVCDGPRLPESWNGRQLALQDDLCVCQCVPPPHLLAIQGLRSQTVDDHSASVAADAEQGAQASRGDTAANDEDLPFRLIDDASNLPYRNRPYRLELGDKVIAGVTDDGGLTRPLSAAERASVLAWHVSEPTGTTGADHG